MCLGNSSFPSVRNERAKGELLPEEFPLPHVNPPLSRWVAGQAVQRQRHMLASGRLWMGLLKMRSLPDSPTGTSMLQAEGLFLPCSPQYPPS